MKNKNKQDNKVAFINIETILTRESNPRKYFDEIALKELAESIMQIGIIQPITLTRAINTKNMYAIVAGERRYRAAKLAGLKEIPSYIIQCEEKDIVNISLTENIQRENMTEVETAETIKIFYEVNNLSFKEIADKLGKSIKYVKDRYQINSLIDDFKGLLNSDIINIGKAVLLATYEAEVQQEVYTKYFAEDNIYNNWLGYSLAKLKDLLDRLYNSVLSKAEFNKSDCQTCNFNSSLGHLFEDEDAQCLNKKCFQSKLQEYKINKATELFDSNPEYIISQGYNVSKWLKESLEEKGYEILDIKATLYPDRPDQPEKPDLTDLSEEEIEEENENYNSELEEYETELEEYNQSIKEIEINLENGTYKNCYRISGDSIQIAYIKIELSQISEKLSDTETKNDAAVIIENDRINNQLEELKKKFEREDSLKIEKAIVDIKEQTITSSFKTDAEFLKIEQDMFYYYVYESLSYDRKQKLFKNISKSTSKEVFEYISNISKEDKVSLMREFITINVRRSAHSTDTIDAQLLIEYSTIHQEIKTEEILNKYQTICTKRQEKITEKINEVEKSVLEIVQDEEN